MAIVNPSNSGGFDTGTQNFSGFSGTLSTTPTKKDPLGYIGPPGTYGQKGHWVQDNYGMDAYGLPIYVYRWVIDAPPPGPQYIPLPPPPAPYVYVAPGPSPAPPALLPPPIPLTRITSSDATWGQVIPSSFGLRRVQGVPIWFNGIQTKGGNGTTLPLPPPPVKVGPVGPNPEWGL